jgi:hypothetical protein
MKIIVDGESLGIAFGRLITCDIHKVIMRIEKDKIYLYGDATHYGALYYEIGIEHQDPVEEQFEFAVNARHFSGVSFEGSAIMEVPSKDKKEVRIMFGQSRVKVKRYDTLDHFRPGGINGIREALKDVDRSNVDLSFGSLWSFVDTSNHRGLGTIVVKDNRMSAGSSYMAASIGGNDHFLNLIQNRTIPPSRLAKFITGNTDAEVFVSCDYLFLEQEHSSNLKEVAMIKLDKAVGDGLHLRKIEERYRSATRVVTGIKVKIIAKFLNSVKNALKSSGKIDQIPSVAFRNEGGGVKIDGPYSTGVRFPFNFSECLSDAKSRENVLFLFNIRFLETVIRFCRHHDMEAISIFQDFKEVNTQVFSVDWIGGWEEKDNQPFVALMGKSPEKMGDALRAEL